MTTLSVPPCDAMNKSTQGIWYITDDKKKIMVKNNNPMAEDIRIANLTALDLANAELIVKAVNIYLENKE